jgi:hypothetical protein
MIQYEKEYGQDAPTIWETLSPVTDETTAILRRRVVQFLTRLVMSSCGQSNLKYNQAILHAIDLVEYATHRRGDPHVRDLHGCVGGIETACVFLQDQ